MRNTIIEQDLRFIASSNVPWGAFEGKNILISGANGFLGNYLVETILYLNETKLKNKAKVFGLDRNGDRFDCYKGRNDFVPIVQDICQPLNIKEKIHFIIHAASKASPKFFGADPVGTLSANVLGTKNLLELAVAKKVEGFLFFSSAEVYGVLPERSMPIKEECFGEIDPLDLRSCYAESKRMGETMCISWFFQHNVPIKIVRPFHIYGPGMNLDDGRVFADFVSNVVKNHNIVVKSNGRSKRAFCYIADATAGFFTILLKGKDGQAYNLANDKAEISIIKLAQMLVKMFPEKNIKIEKGKQTQKGYLQSRVSRYFPSIAKISALGWKPSFGLEKGFERTIKSFI